MKSSHENGGFFVAVLVGMKGLLLFVIIIVTSQNQRDRIHAEEDYKTNIDAKKEIEELTKKLNSIEVDKLDKIMKMLEEMKARTN